MTREATAGTPGLRLDLAQTRTELLDRLFAPVDIAPLVFFRIAFGVIMLAQVIRYLTSGLIREYWIEPEFNFTYFMFEWVRPWPGDGMYIHFVVLGVAAACIALGFWYRLAAAVFCVGFAYTFLLEQATYLNHFYLVILMSFLLVFIPAHRAFSVDAWRNPEIRAQTAPAWALYLILAQIAIVYFYAGLAKLNPDWLSGEPMRQWLGNRSDYPVFGPLLGHDWAPWFFSYGGLGLDLFVVPLLLIRRTRLIAFGFAVLFHAMNLYLFNIGIFPWFMIAATMLFFPAHWFRVRGLFGESPPTDRPPPSATGGLSGGQKTIVAFLAVYLVVQLLVPLRHHLYPGKVNWTEEGHRFAWHMLLRQKQADAQFTVVHPESGSSWTINNREYLHHRQERKMSSRPDMILQFAHHLASDFEKRGYSGVEVYAHVWASLNSRPYQFLVDPEVDLTNEKRSIRAASWIVPLE